MRKLKIGAIVPLSVVLIFCAARAGFCLDRNNDCRSYNIKSEGSSTNPSSGTFKAGDTFVWNGVTITVRRSGSFSDYFDQVYLNYLSCNPDNQNAFVYSPVPGEDEKIHKRLVTIEGNRKKYPVPPCDGKETIGKLKETVEDSPAGREGIKLLGIDHSREISLPENYGIMSWGENTIEKCQGVLIFNDGELPFIYGYEVHQGDVYLFMHRLNL